MDLEGSRAPFGRGLERVLGGVWQHWRALRPFLGVIFSCLYLGWSSKGLLEASGLDFDRILGGLEGILGGFGEGFGRDFAGFCLLLRFPFHCYSGLWGGLGTLFRTFFTFFQFFNAS